MFKTRYSKLLAAVMALAAYAMPAGQARVYAAAADEKLIAVLQSNAAPGEKAITCKQLAIYGTKDAVPALAALLPDKDLSSWARIALEAIPDSSADDALRQALDKAQGRTLVGVINSIAFRRDAKAVDGLILKLKGADADVASAAAVALGRIGGDQAAKVLEQTLPNASTTIRSAVAEGCILAAERFIAADKRDQAADLCDVVRKADVPKQRLREATRGAIIARQAAGIPLLLEQLRSQDKAMFTIALSVAREMALPQVTDALIAEFAKATPDHQALLLFALADRADAKAMPVVLEAAKSGPVNVRIAAANVLERLGNATCVPVLVDAAIDADADLSQAAKTALARLGGKDVDAAIFARLQQSSGKMRQLLIELAEQRRIDGALAVFITCAGDADAGVRGAALVAIGAIGQDKQTADLAVLLQKTQDAAARQDIEKALTAICGRWAAACMPYLRPLAQSADGANRIVALHALACCGGDDALAAVKAALDDKDETVVDEAVRTLSTWANRWPEDAGITQPLLALAKTGKKPSHQVLAQRGYLQFVQGGKKVPAAQKLAKINEILPLVTRPEEKRLVVAILASTGTGAALDMLTTFAADPTISEEACSAIVTLTSKPMPGATKPQRQKALQAAVDNSKNAATKKKAEGLLKAIK